MQSIIFTDGHIVAATQTDGYAEVAFSDYCQNEFVMKFRGVTHFFESKHALKYEVMSSKVSKRDEAWFLRLSDDDDETLLELEFSHVDVEH